MLGSTWKIARNNSPQEQRRMQTYIHFYELLERHSLLECLPNRS